MVQIDYYNPTERQIEKDRARVADDYALRSGNIAREELRMHNSLLAPLQIIGSSVEHQNIID